MSITIINGNVTISNIRSGGGIHINGMSGLSNVTEGDGEYKSADRQVTEPFDSVVLESSVDANVVCGRPGAPKVAVSGDSNLLDMVTTRVEDGALHIGAKGNFSTQHPLKVDVQTDKLLKATLQASGSVAVQGLSQPTFQALMLASGDLKASGQVDSLRVDINGSGDYDGFGLKARQASVNVNGSGDAEVHASGALQAFIAGSGDVTYKGSPKVSSRLLGSGDLEAY